MRRNYPCFPEFCLQCFKWHVPLKVFLKAMIFANKKYFACFEIALTALDDKLLYFLKDSAEN